MTPIVKDMVHDDPSQRPTIQDVVRRFDELLANISQRTLRSRLIAYNEEPALTLFRNLRHRFRTIFYILFRKAAVPMPR